MTTETLYAERPEVYDVLYADKPYESEVEWVLERFAARAGAESRQGSEPESTAEPGSTAEPESTADPAGRDANGDAGDRFGDRAAADRDGPTPDRALVVGCGTGEHARHLRRAGVAVTGVDRYGAMVERARGKHDRLGGDERGGDGTGGERGGELGVDRDLAPVEFRVDRLPDLSVDGEYDLVWAPFTVLNHLAPDAVGPAVRSMAGRVAPGGLLVVDTLSVPDEGTPPRLSSTAGEDGAYARLVQTHAVDGDGDDRRRRWDSVVFCPDGTVFVDGHDLWNYEDPFVEALLSACGLEIAVHDWYGQQLDQEPSVFVGVDG